MPRRATVNLARGGSPGRGCGLARRVCPGLPPRARLNAAPPGRFHLLRSFGLALFLILAACGGDRASGPLPHEAYVWQHQWNATVREAVAQAAPLSGLVVLGAEVDFRRQPVRVARVPLDPSLRGSNRAVGAALRIHTFPGRFADSPAAVRLIVDLSRGLAQEARRAGISLSEIQLDYDCPDSRLEDYPALIAAVREAVAPVPVTITALPSWLRRERAFQDLVTAADGYVLQVHSLSPPAGPDAPLTLYDPEAARRAVEKAAGFRQPFRVALPTYGYSVVFDAQGRRAGVSAEGPPLRPPPGGKLRTVRSDPEELAALVRGWTEDRPAELAGVIWYRLPLASDRLNWPPATFRAVLAGRTPRTEIDAEVRRPDPGMPEIIEIDLVNRGETEALWPARVRVRWSHSRTLAADGLAGYRIVRTTPREILLARIAAEGAPGRPGDRRTVAWLRLAPAPVPGGEEIRVELAPPAAP